MTRKRSNYRPRHIHADPLRVARNQATTLTDAELAQISGPIRAAFDALRRGAATQDHWCVLAGALHMAQNIERQGVVRGLSHHLQAADAALVAVEQRATRTDHWRAPTLYAAEIEAIDTLVDVHLYQVQQLSYGEFRAAYQQTVGQVRTRGGQVVMGVAGHG